MEKVYTIALAGNPNSGKTTIFNRLTGAKQHVGNYPGVTVERKVGSCVMDGQPVEIIDLPGIYSISSSSPEEKVVFNELLETRIDLILNIIDSSNLQRNLYLTTQLAELDIPMLLVFNMADDAVRRGLEFDLPKLERYFGAPIVKTVGSGGAGIDNLKSMTAKLLRGELVSQPVHLKYGEHADAAIAELIAAIERLKLPESWRVPPRCFAVKLLEKDEIVCAMPQFASLLPLAEAWYARPEHRYGTAPETFIADQRYGMIAGAYRDAVRINQLKRREITAKLDTVFASRIFGLPIFLLVMAAVFFLVIKCADPFIGLIDGAFAGLGDLLKEKWPAGSLEWLKDLLADGVIGGVGGVLVFLPNILLLFLAMAFLEGTGYMARAAFVMDGFMRKFGLHGKSFIPMLLGFGCSVPAVMATRTIESHRDRMTTIMVIPFMSCAARMPIYALIIPAFFAGNAQVLALWSIYVLGIVVAMVCALILKSTMFKGGDDVFVMELPPYRLPTARSLVIHMWERAVMYLKKAGTIILLAAVILYFINTFPKKTEFSRDYDAAIAAVEASALDAEAKDEQLAALHGRRNAELLEYSAAGRIGRTLEVALRPLGFDWKVSSALIGAFAAKELFVAQLGVLFAIDEADEESAPLREQIRASYTPLQGFAIMVFCLLSLPCMATVAVVRRETGSWGLTLLQMGGMTAVAYTVTLVIYQAGLLLNLGTKML